MTRVPPTLVDTDVRLYLQSSNTREADIAEKLLAEGPCASLQVLSEFTAVTRGELKLDGSAIDDIVGTLERSAQSSR